MSGVPQNRKWRLALWGMWLGTLISLAAVGGWFADVDGSIAVLGQGLGLVTLIFGGYSTANITQKRVIDEKEGISDGTE